MQQESSAERPAQNTPAGLATVFAGFIMFGSSPPLVAGSNILGLMLALWRAGVSTLLFGGISLLRGNSRGALRYGFAPGIMFGLAIGLFFEAAQRTSVANATIIAAMQPIPMMIAARFIFSERVGRIDAGWFMLALAGASIIVLAADTSGTSSLGGDVFAAVSTLFSAGYFIASRRSREHIDAVPLMAGSWFWAGVVLVPASLIAGQDFVAPQGADWVRLAAIALIPGLGHLLITYSQKLVSLVVIGLAQLLMPVSASLLAWIFLGQAVGFVQLGGMLLVMVALAAHTMYRASLEPSG